MRRQAAFKACRLSARHGKLQFCCNFNGFHSKTMYERCPRFGLAPGCLRSCTRVFRQVVKFLVKTVTSAMPPSTNTSRDRVFFKTSHILCQCSLYKVAFCCRVAPICVSRASPTVCDTKILYILLYIFPAGGKHVKCVVKNNINVGLPSSGSASGRRQTCQMCCKKLYKRRAAFLWKRLRQEANM